MHLRIHPTFYTSLLNLVPLVHLQFANQPLELAAQSCLVLCSVSCLNLLSTTGCRLPPWRFSVEILRAFQFPVCFSFYMSALNPADEQSGAQFLSEISPLVLTMLVQFTYSQLLTGIFSRPRCTFFHVQDFLGVAPYTQIWILKWYILKLNMEMRVFRH